MVYCPSLIITPIIINNAATNNQQSMGIRHLERKLHCTGFLTWTHDLARTKHSISPHNVLVSHRKPPALIHQAAALHRGRRLSIRSPPIIRQTALETRPLRSLSLKHTQKPKHTASFSLDARAPSSPAFCLRRDMQRRGDCSRDNGHKLASWWYAKWGSNN